MGYEINQPDPELNLAPLIDVVFLLLIFFIVASTLNVREVKKEIKLPTTKAVEQKKKTEVSIFVTKEGQLYVGEEKVSWASIETYLANKLKEAAKKEITIFADKKVEFQQVVKLMDIAKQLQISNLNFVLRRKEK